MRDLLIAIGIVCAVLLLAMASRGSDVLIRDGQSVTLVANTPQAVGVAAGRVELNVVNAHASNSMSCGTTPGSLSLTPGASSGFIRKSGESVLQRLMASIAYYCMAPSGGLVSYEEVRAVTATPTATATATPTRTP